MMMLANPFYLLQTTYNAIHPLYSVCAITFVAGTLGMAGRTFKQGWNHLRQLHQVPCSRCAYFTGDYRLKCTVHPVHALTEDAIGCKDFEPASSSPTPPCYKGDCWKH